LTIYFSARQLQKKHLKPSKEFRKPFQQSTALTFML